MDILWSDYDMAADRKTVARNLCNLMAAGYPIECRDDVARAYINKQEAYCIMNNHYDQKLKTIDFYKIHPEYLPFVGDAFE